MFNYYAPEQYTMAIDYVYLPDQNAVKFVDSDGQTFTVSMYDLMNDWKLVGQQKAIIEQAIKAKKLVLPEPTVPLHPPVPPIMTEEI